MAKQNDKQRSTKHTHKTKGRVIRTPVKSGGELWCSEGWTGPKKYTFVSEKHN